MPVALVGSVGFRVVTRVEIWVGSPFSALGAPDGVGVQRGATSAGGAGDSAPSDGKQGTWFCCPRTEPAAA